MQGFAKAFILAAWPRFAAAGVRLVLVQLPRAGWDGSGMSQCSLPTKEPAALFAKFSAVLAFQLDALFACSGAFCHVWGERTTACIVCS